MNRHRLLWVLAGVCCGAPCVAQAPARTASAATRISAYAIDSALADVFSLPLWPGFDPARTPVAIFDGENTVLFRHPSPPPGYYSLSSRRGVDVRPGRDTLVNSNTSVVLAGVPTATLMLRSGGGQSARTWAAVTAHEIFHVFQRSRHPTWTANEADLFTYPVDNAGALALRRAETSALRRALAVGRPDSVGCWAGAFSRTRRARFQAIGVAAASYERGTELNEGLARYVELRAAGRQVVLSPADFPPEQVRARAYEIGAAMGQLLDRIMPAWRDTLESAPPFPNVSLDAMLDRATESVPITGRTLRCAETRTDSAANSAHATADVRDLAARRKRDRTALLARPGWRIVIDASASPLFPQGFDPLNVSRVSATDVLHSRFLKLGNGRVSVELLGRPALTEGRAGQHPLFAGVRRLTIPGITGPMAVSDSAGVIFIEASGLQARLRDMTADTAGKTILLHPPRARP